MLVIKTGISPYRTEHLNYLGDVSIFGANIVTVSTSDSIISAHLKIFCVNVKLHDFRIHTEFLP